jgi:hypothetical protein
MDPMSSYWWVAGPQRGSCSSCAGFLPTGQQEYRTSSRDPIGAQDSLRLQTPLLMFEGFRSRFSQELT